jgi:hypothetical protein
MNRYDAADELERREQERRQGGSMSVWDKLIDLAVKAGGALAAAAVIGMVVWSVSVSNARDKVSDHSDRLRTLEHRAEQIDRRVEVNEALTKAELGYIRTALEAINKKLDRDEGRR